jgi:hypothetical protein
VLAVLALDPGKAFSEIPAAKVLVDDLPDNIPQNAILVLIPLSIDRLELGEVLRDRLVQRRSLGLSWLVDNLDHPVFSPEGSRTQKTLSDGILQKDQSPIPFSDERIHLIENRAPILSPTCARADPLAPLSQSAGNFHVPFCPTYPSFRRTEVTRIQ